MRYVVGIDPSLTGTGVSVLTEDGTCDLKLFSSKADGYKIHDRIKRYSDLTSEILRFIPGYAQGDYCCVAAICIEGYAMGLKGTTQVYLSEFGGLLRFRLASRYETIFEVPPSTLKEWATGKGAFKGGGKVPLVVALTKRYDVQFATDDEYDAYGLSRMALQIAKFEACATQFQADAIDVAVNGKPKKARKPRVVKE